MSTNDDLGNVMGQKGKLTIYDYYDQLYISVVLLRWYQENIYKSITCLLKVSQNKNLGSGQIWLFLFSVSQPFDPLFWFKFVI